MNYSYITLLSDDSYIFGVILLNKSLKDEKSKYPLEVLVTPNVSAPILNILDQLKLKYTIVDAITNDKMTQYNSKINTRFAKIWHLCLTKFELFRMTQYDKIVYLDADVMVLKNLDHLFEYPHLTSALDGEYYNIWPNEPHFNAGVMVIEPNKEEYNKLIEFSKDTVDNWNKKMCVADQEILNMYFSDWNNKPELHLNKYYDVFASYIQEEDIKDIEDNCYFIHYIGRKPWRAFQKPGYEHYTEYFFDMAHEIIQTEVNKLNWDEAKKYLKVAVYAICKDEIVNVEKYINCFSKADYLCILDTGSTDGTWEYLQNKQKKLPNLIIDQKIISPWRYDEARNASLKLIPKDASICFMADLDEIIKEDNWVDVIKNNWQPLFQRGAFIYNRRVDPDTGAVIQRFTEYRIHSKNWHYRGIVHEQLHDVNGAREFFLDECIQVPITVWHYPTNPNREIYVELCERGIEEQPNNWLMHLQLAAEYEVHEMYDKAIDEYKKIILEQDMLSPMEVGRCYASLGRVLGITGKKEEALRILKKGRTEIPNYGDNYFLAAEITYQMNNYEETFELCKNGLENASENQWCTIVARESYYPYFLMGLSKYYLGDKINGLAYVAIAREKNMNEETNKVFALMMNEIINRG